MAESWVEVKGLRRVRCGPPGMSPRARRTFRNLRRGQDGAVRLHRGVLQSGAPSGRRHPRSRDHRRLTHPVPLVRPPMKGAAGEERRNDRNRCRFKPPASVSSRAHSSRVGAPLPRLLRGASVRALVEDVSGLNGADCHIGRTRVRTLEGFGEACLRRGPRKDDWSA